MTGNAPRPLLVKGGTIVTMNSRREVLRGDLLVVDGRITQIGERVHETSARVLDASDLIVLPGFVQTHVHLIQTLFRGVADDASLLEWLAGAVWPLEAAHDARSARASVRLAVAELLVGGTTAIMTMETVHHTDVILETLSELPIYASVGKCLMDTGEGVPRRLLQPAGQALAEADEIHQRWNGAAGDRLRTVLAPRFALSCSEGLLREVGQMAVQKGIAIHTHAAENRTETAEVLRKWGIGNIFLFHRLGLTAAPLKLAHCVWLEPGERELLRDSGASVLHCPTANLKLGSGVAEVSDMLAGGVAVSLGADGAACNNVLSIFREMRHAALLQKVRCGPEALPAADVVAMATIEGARALGRDTEMGSLEVGKRGNLVLVDLHGLHCIPGHDLYGSIVFSAGASDVAFTIVDGQVVVSRGRLVDLPEGEIRLDARREARRLFDRAGLN